MVAGAIQLIERLYHEAWNRADEAVAREILHPEFRFCASLGPERLGPERLGPERLGPEGFVAYMRSVHAALADYRCEIQEIVESGDKREAAAKMRFVGYHQAPFFGVEATGKEVEWAGAAFFKTNGERITELWVLGDIDAVKRQLGAAAEQGFESE